MNFFVKVAFKTYPYLVTFKDKNLTKSNLSMKTLAEQHHSTNLNQIFIKVFVNHFHKMTLYRHKISVLFLAQNLTNKARFSGIFQHQNFD